MKKNWRKIVSLLLVLAMVGGLLTDGVVVKAEETIPYRISIWYDAESGNGGADMTDAIKAENPEDYEAYHSMSEEPYWKNDGAGSLVQGTMDDYNLKYETATNTLYFKGLDVTYNYDENNFIWSDVDLNIVVESDSSIKTKGLPVYVVNDLNISGTGNLTIQSLAEEYMPAVVVETGNVHATIDGTLNFIGAGDAFGMEIYPTEGMLTADKLTYSDTVSWGEKSLPSRQGILLTDENMMIQYTDIESEVFLCSENGRLMLNGADTDNYNIKYVPGEVNTLYLKNAALFSDDEGIRYMGERELRVVLEGENRITSQYTAFVAGGDDYSTEEEEYIVSEKITFGNSAGGNGSLHLTSTAYESSALSVHTGKFVNDAAIYVAAEDNTPWAGDILDGGISGRGLMAVTKEGQYIYNDVSEQQFTKIQYSEEIAGNTLPVTDDTNMPGATGKCYYIYDFEEYPNEHMELYGEHPVRIYGRYDEEGNPIPSNIVIQLVTYTEYGVPYMDDFEYPEHYLVYPEDMGGKTIEEFVKNCDIVSVCDGGTYVFNTDIYRAWIESGDVTVNGDILCDVAMFEAAVLGDGPTDWQRDEEGNILRWRDSTDAKLTVNGNVGFLGINDSYQGDVSVTGTIECVGIIDDETIENGQEQVDLYYFASYPSGSGIDLVVDGELKKETMVVGGALYDEGDFLGYGVYEYETYVMTAGTEEGKEVKGTCSVIDDSTATISVTAESVTEGSTPLLKNTDAASKEIVQDVIGNEAEFTAFDLALLENNAEKVQPTTDMTVYISDSWGYEEPVVCYVNPDGTLEKHETKTVDGKIAFDTNHLSTYVIVEAASLGDDVKPDDTDKPVPSDKVTTETVVGTNAPVTSMNTTKETLLAASGLLTAEEKARVESGEVAKIWLEVKEATVSTEEKTKMEEKAKSEIGTDAALTYIDLTLWKQVGADTASKVAEPGTKISVTITIPQNLRNTDATKTRAYAIVRLHNGVTSVINGTLDANWNFTFETDGFSTYAIAYKDTDIVVNNTTTDTTTDTTNDSYEVAGSDIPASPATGEESSVAVLWMLLVGLCVVVSSKKYFIK